MNHAIMATGATILLIMVVACGDSRESGSYPRRLVDPTSSALGARIPEVASESQDSSLSSTAVDSGELVSRNPTIQHSRGKSPVQASYPLLTIPERLASVDYVLRVSVDQVGKLRYSTANGNEPDSSIPSTAGDSGFVALIPVTMTVQHVYKSPLPAPQRVVTADWAPPSSGLFAMDKQMQYLAGQEGILFSNRMESESVLSTLPVIHHLESLSQALTTQGQSNVVLALAYEWMLIIDSDVYGHRFEEHLALPDVLDQLE